MGDRQRLAEDVIQARLAQHAGWAFEDNGLVRTFKCASFPDAIAFLTRLAFDAEAADHHPDLSLSYRTVRVRWSTHSEGGVTAKDFDGVAAVERVAPRFIA